MTIGVCFIDHEYNLDEDDDNHDDDDDDGVNDDDYDDENDAADDDDDDGAPGGGIWIWLIVVMIREELEFQQTNNPLPDPSFEEKKLEHFTAITETLVEKTIRTFASKSCDLDPIPTDLLKKYVKNPCVLSYITSIFNQSLQSGAVPEEFKKALVNPMLKKPNLDESDSKNFRPVSNLPFLSKVLEKLVAQQLLAHLDKYGLKNRFQSAYRSNHSTETALI
ncbi:RNA-directed DNA polymerase from mobile element jockey [Elysia marginata]|uniref:RNA-directed DNA polymerase from mobile element jockey n=1 Tax=Elysia marginata TaxID=1093978 RepID=A0AAV4FYU0_9GAST|nr:RNA-directed DNA polymerase from mobile element jockey [Elysia marginata]